MKNVDIPFGPVPSRRLGRSVGINNIPPKVCSYTCTYCQLGRTIKLRADRSRFYGATRVITAVEEKLRELERAKREIDFLTFVPDGEPTLDAEIGEEILALRRSGIKIAVITNSSLIWKKEVREALAEADWVSLKVDTLSPKIWRLLDRPHHSLRLDHLLEGAIEFRRTYNGTLATETMLVRDINDREEELVELTGFLSKLSPDRAYISVPTRPPAEPKVEPPEERSVTAAYQIFSETLPGAVECLVGYEGNAFASTGVAEADILSITAVHPMRSDAVAELLTEDGADWTAVEGLIEAGDLVQTVYRGELFYARRITPFVGSSSKH